VNISMEARCFSFGHFVLIPARQALMRRGAQVRLGARALEILTALVEKPGTVIDKQELISRVWTDTFVDESNLKVQIAALRKALDEDAAQPSCIATVIGKGYRFVEPVLDGAMNASIEREKPGQNSPKCSNDLFGRDAIVQQVASEVDEHRLVTLVGPAGIGKTAVAAAVAKLVAPGYADGACLVNLCTLRDPGQVHRAVARALGIGSETNNVEERLLLHLSGAEMLILLDTCEGAIDEVAAFVELIQSSCPRVHIVATSREILRTSRERVFRVPALDTPQSSLNMTAAELRHYPAIQLFLDRATEEPEDCELTDSEAALIGTVCAELDGVPLAIELAARRVRALGFAGSPSVFTEDLFEISYGERTGPRRHQNLGAALEWSLDLLPENERLVLLRLAKLEGRFDLEEAIAVASGSAMLDAEAAACIANLVSKSLLEREGHGKASFRLLNIVRNYLRRKLPRHFLETVGWSGGRGLTDSVVHGSLCREHSLSAQDSDCTDVVCARSNRVLTFPRKCRFSLGAAST